MYSRCSVFDSKTDFCCTHTHIYYIKSGSKYFTIINVFVFSRTKQFSRRISKTYYLFFTSGSNVLSLWYSENSLLLNIDVFPNVYTYCVYRAMISFCVNNK